MKEAPLPLKNVGSEGTQAASTPLVNMSDKVHLNASGATSVAPGWAAMSPPYCYGWKNGFGVGASACYLKDFQPSHWVESLGPWSTPGEFRVWHQVLRS